MPPRVVAFHLPQFHPIPENDRWWGKGFTEWTNVVRARPQFPGHHQPHLPADLGFYDLRLPETRSAQAELAQEYGIAGFCYYHYWFNGRRLLERPVNEILSTREPRFPFCLCWANENWTRRWDGKDAEILIAQQYGEDGDRRHMQWLAGAFRDDRYIRIDEKPVFLVYRARMLPDPARTAEIWRETAWALGVGEIYLCRVESFPDERDDPRSIGFDAAVEFQPDWDNFPPALRREARWGYARTLGLASDLYQRHDIYEYDQVVRAMLAKPRAEYKRFPAVTPSWDNSARRRNHARIIRGSTPELYEQWLTTVLRRFTPFSPEENLVFVNAWNEWGEGNHIEPCHRWQRGYLDATRSAIQAAGGSERSGATAAAVGAGLTR